VSDDREVRRQAAAIAASLRKKTTMTQSTKMMMRMDDADDDGWNPKDAERARSPSCQDRQTMMTMMMKMKWRMRKKSQLKTRTGQAKLEQQMVSLRAVDVDDAVDDGGDGMMNATVQIVMIAPTCVSQRTKIQTTAMTMMTRTETKTMMMTVRLNRVWRSWMD
jgi:hypothetical protein